MDGLSGVASGMAVISLSLQLIQSINHIKTKIRHVKGAPAEAERLTRLLDRLGALLDEVRQITEYQSSCAAEAIPMPSMTIFDCLKGCETQIEPLMQIIRDYERHETSSGSKLAKLRRNAKIGFKAKDIGAFEDRIQQEFDRLSMALTLNNTRQLHALHVLVGRQALVPLPRESVHVNSTTSIVRASENVSFPTDASKNTSALKHASFRLTMSRQRFGIYRQELTRTKLLRYDALKEPFLEDGNESYEETYFWACKVLGYGIRWSRQRLYATVLPSISTFPVISEFGDNLLVGILCHDASRLEQVFRKGELHPFTRDQYGNSLFHIAACFCAWDICQLLGRLGVKADADFFGDHPLDRFLRFFFPTHLPGTGTIDTLRFFTQGPYFVESMDTIRQRNFLYLPPEASVWLWKNRAEVFYGQDTSELANIYLGSLVYGLGIPEYRPRAIEYLQSEFASEFRNGLVGGSLRFFECLFPPEIFKSSDTANSYDSGDAFVHLIDGLGIDVDECIRKERDMRPRGLVSYDLGSLEWMPDRKLVAEHTPDRGWILGWEWAYDEEQPGYLLVSEYSMLAADTLDTDEDFPFPAPDISRDFEFLKRSECKLQEWQEWQEWQKWPEWQIWQKWKERQERQERQQGIRFERRSAAKSRRELARMGQKQSRCQMPGSWIH